MRQGMVVGQHAGRGRTGKRVRDGESHLLSAEKKSTAATLSAGGKSIANPTPSIQSGGSTWV